MLDHLFSSVLGAARRKRKLLFLIADILIIGFSVYASFLVRFEGSVPARYDVVIARLVLINILFCVPVFYFQKLYDISWSFVSLQDLIALAKATVISFLLTIGTLFLLKGRPAFSGFPRSVIFINYFFIFILCGGTRFAKRLFFQIFPATDGNNKKRTIIVGAGEAGEQIARSIIGSKVSPYKLIGFVDDNKAKWGNLIHGTKVLGPIEKIPEIVKGRAVEEMIIALPSAGTKAIKQAVELGRAAGLNKIKTVPSISEVIDGKISFANIREVEVEDLLERDPIVLDTRSIEQFIRNKSVLVTGGAGSIGSELCRQIARFGPERLLILDQDETGIFNISQELGRKFESLNIGSVVCDICDSGKVDRIFRDYCPAVVFHAAAYKHVPLMEALPDEAVKNNIFGTKTIAEAALNHHTEKFIMISTDKAVNPSSVMGATKRVCEMICQNLNQKNSTKFISVRFGNVLNSRGSVIPIFREQIKNGGPVEVTDPEMKRYFMLTSEACLLVMQAAQMGLGGEVFVLDMGKPVKIVDLAREMIRLSGFEPDKDIPIVFIGIRPGEKLFEEILTAEEGVLTTQNQKIFIAKLSKIDDEKLFAALKQLQEASLSGNREGVFTALRELLPSYLH